MITEDYLMRQIEIIARALAKLLFGKDSTEYVTIDDQRLKETDVIHNKLCELIDDRNINGAENLLFEYIGKELEENPGGRDYLEVAIDFYSRLNDLDTKILEDCGFEREEIAEGMREVSEIYGINVI